MPAPAPAPQPTPSAPRAIRIVARELGAVAAAGRREPARDKHVTLAATGVADLSATIARRFGCPAADVVGLHVVGGDRIERDAHVVALRDGAVVAWRRRRVLEGELIPGAPGAAVGADGTGSRRARRPTLVPTDVVVARPVTPGDDADGDMPTAVAVWFEEDAEGVLQIRSRRR